MSLHTKLCDLLGVKHPVMLAGMGGVSYAELAAAVTNAGGYGVLGMAGHGPDFIRDQMRKVRSLTDGPFGVDLLAASPDSLTAAVDVIIEEGASSFVAGLGVPEDEANATSRQAAFAGETPKVYIPFPAPGALSTLRSNGLAILPGILEGQSGRTASGLQSGLSTIQSGAPVINGGDSILLQGARSKRWTIFVPMASGPADQDAGDQ